MAATVGELVVSLVARTGQFVSGLKGAERQVQGFSASVASSASKLGGWATAAIGVGSAAMAFRSVVNTLKEMDETGKAADRLGIATEKLLGLRYAADLAGGGAEGMDKALQKMQVNLGKAAALGGETAEVFTRLGLDIKKLSGMTADQQFYAIADAVKEYGTSADRAAAVTMIFGKSAADLTNLIAEGSDGLRAYQKELENTGAVYNRTVAAMAEEVNDSVTRAQARLKGLGLGLLLLPKLLSNAFTGSLEESMTHDIVMQQQRAAKQRADAYAAAMAEAKAQQQALEAAHIGKSPIDSLDIAELGLSDSEKRIRAWQREAEAIGMAREEISAYVANMRGLAEMQEAWNEQQKKQATVRSMLEAAIKGGDGAQTFTAPPAATQNSAEAYAILSRRNMQQPAKQTDRDILRIVTQQLEEDRKMNDRLDLLLGQMDLDQVEIR